MHRARYALTLAVLSALVVAAPVSATPPETGCPTGFVARSVEVWALLGYPGPGFIDEAGNQDGFVCGLALREGFTWGWAITAHGLTPLADILYLFSDNDSPAQR